MAARHQYFSDSKSAAERRSDVSSDLNLGKGTRLLYMWLRKTIGVPMRFGIAGGDKEEMDAHVSRVYEGMVRGDINTVLLDCLRGGDDSKYSRGSI